MVAIIGVGVVETLQNVQLLLARLVHYLRKQARNQTLDSIIHCKGTYVLGWSDIEKFSNLN